MENREYIKSVFERLKADEDVGFTEEEVAFALSGEKAEMPLAYLEFLKCMGKYNYIFGGECHHVAEIKEYKRNFLSSVFIREIYEEQLECFRDYTVFLSSQGCNWLMFKKVDTDDPEVFLASEIQIEPRLIYPSFTNMVIVLKKRIERKEL